MSDAAAEAAAKAALLVNSPGTTFGPLMMGLCLDSIFLGIVLNQFVQWFSYARPNERTIIQVVVIYSVIMSVAVSFLTVCWMMHLFAYNYGLYVPFTDIRWFSFYPLLDGLTTCVVQTFFAERAYKLAGRSKILVAAVAPLIVLSLVGAVAIPVCGMLSDTTDKRYNTFLYFWVSGTAAADLIITGVVMWGLMRSRSEWEQTDMLIKRLIKVACETQLPPTVMALALFLDLLCEGDSFYGALLEMIQVKIYVFGMIFVLNSRFRLRRDLDDGAHHSVIQKPNTFALKSTRSGNYNGPATIHVQTETYVESHPIDTAYAKPMQLQPVFDNKEPSESDSNSVHNLDYINNSSEIGLRVSHA